MAKQMLDTKDGLFSIDDSSLDNSLACNELFFTECASPKSIDENKQRRRCLSASIPNCLQSYKDDYAKFNLINYLRIIN